DVEITSLKINARAVHLFVKLGIKTLEDLSKYTRRELVSCPDFGWNSMAKLDKSLEDTGLKLKHGKKAERLPEEFRL
ncbi:MAG TPA: hypothetical protein EYO81_05485, partial [Gammaproteobacteria bacterium]|nr:hypothetical protein [Gammaproteobacteria bacterium]